MFETMVVNPEVAKLWLEQSKDLTPELQAYLDHAAEVAKEIFSEHSKERSQHPVDHSG